MVRKEYLDNIQLAQVKDNDRILQLYQVLTNGEDIFLDQMNEPIIIRLPQMLSTGMSGMFYVDNPIITRAGMVGKFMIVTKEGEYAIVSSRKSPNVNSKLSYMDGMNQLFSYIIGCIEMGDMTIDMIWQSAVL